MGEVKSNGSGGFEVSGSLHEITNIDPKLNIYHDCNDWKVCNKIHPSLNKRGHEFQKL